MKTTNRFFCLGLFASVLGGCAADASPAATGNEKVAVASAADTAGYLQTFDQDFQAIIFQPSSTIDWVILHVTIDGTRTTNVSMPEIGTSAAAGPAYEIESLPVLPGDTVVYSFTYSVNGLAQDTPQFTYALPTSWVPTTFYTGASASAITAVSTATLAWADAHYTVNGGTQLNVRLTQDGTSYVQPLTLNPGDVLQYSVTYSTGPAVFDTAVAEYTVPTNLLAGPWQFVSSDVTPSNAYSIDGDTIDLDFQGYFSWSGSSYQGYTFQQPVAVVQGATYVLTVNVTNTNVPVPAVVEAWVSGAGAEQEQSSFGNGVLTFTFPVSSDPGSAPVIDLVAHPVLGQIGPVVGTGIGVQSYDLTASLVRQ
jgi:carbohydrate binding protein with CBM56 domain